uniref:RING-type E3 ubiquitin transferase n=1 Tax=Bubo bubo TaxID=30461 RepID=A0A8C0F1L7_BUBBB
SRAGAAPVGGSNSTSPAPPSPPQHMKSGATELDSRCPICLDSWEEASYVMPCLHQFCYNCILQWAETKPECPLCKRRITSVLHSVHQAVGAPGRPAAHSPAPTEQPPVGMVPRAPLGGVQPSTWASIFRDHPALFQSLLPWVHQELGLIFGNHCPSGGSWQPSLCRCSYPRGRRRAPGGARGGHGTSVYFQPGQESLP